MMVTELLSVRTVAFIAAFPTRDRTGSFLLGWPHLHIDFPVVDDLTELVRVLFLLPYGAIDDTRNIVCELEKVIALRPLHLHLVNDL